MNNCQPKSAPNPGARNGAIMRVLSFFPTLITTICLFTLLFTPPRTASAATSACPSGATYNAGTDSCQTPAANTIITSAATGVGANPYIKKIGKATTDGTCSSDCVQGSYRLDASGNPYLSAYQAWGGALGEGLYNPNWSWQTNSNVNTRSWINSTTKTVMTQFFLCGFQCHGGGCGNDLCTIRDPGTGICQAWLQAGTLTPFFSILDCNATADPVCMSQDTKTGNLSWHLGNPVYFAVEDMNNTGTYLGPYTTYYNNPTNLFEFCIAGFSAYYCGKANQGAGDGAHCAWSGTINVKQSDITGCPDGFLSSSLSPAAPSTCTPIYSYWGVYMGDSCTTPITSQCWSTSATSNRCPNGLPPSGGFCNTAPSCPPGSIRQGGVCICSSPRYPTGWTNPVGPFAPGAPLTASDINAMRTDINLMRQDANLVDCNWAVLPISSGSAVLASHFTSMQQCIMQVYDTCGRARPMSHANPNVYGVGAGIPLLATDYADLWSAIANAP